MTLETLLTSKSRYAVLKLLALRSTPLHLRAIAEATGLSPRGAQLACDFLTAAKTLTVTREGNKKFFQFNPSEGLSKIIHRHFMEEQSRQLALRSNRYENAKGLFEQVEQIVTFTRGARL